VAAHAEVADVVEEDDAGCAGWVGGRAEQRADEDVGAAGLVDQGGAEMVVMLAEEIAAFRKRAGS
jgi:hypothetical protein